MPWTTVDELARASAGHDAAIRLSELLLRTSLIHHAGVEESEVKDLLIYHVEEGISVAEGAYLELTEEAKARIRDQVIQATTIVIAEMAVELWRSASLISVDPGTIDPSHVVLAATRRLLSAADEAEA